MICFQEMKICKRNDESFCVLWEGLLNIADFLFFFFEQSDSGEVVTVCGIGNRKNYLLQQVLEKDGVEIYESTVRLLRELAAAGAHLTSLAAWMANQPDLRDFHQIFQQKKEVLEFYCISILSLFCLPFIAGIKRGVASSSKNCEYVLKSAMIEDLLQTRVDGVVSAQLGLKVCTPRAWWDLA